MAKIPHRIQVEHVREAIKAFDDGVEHDFGESRDYDLLHGNKRYPPKAIIGIAAEYATGQRLHHSDFSSGIGAGQACRVLHDLGFQIVAKQSDEDVFAKVSVAIITENDESEWDDTTGVSYHFPKRYLKYLAPGTKVVYYKGGLKNLVLRDERLSDKPHYFGIAKIGGVYPDSKSTKDDHFAEIQGFQHFSRPVLAKQDDGFIEIIPDSRVSNYWRDGVRPIPSEVFQRIESLASIDDYDDADRGRTNDDLQGGPESLTSGVDGKPGSRFGTVYERDPKLRAAAIRLHGTTCTTCGFNFAETFGQHGAGYIQAHHLEPLGDEPGERIVDANTDLAVLCANCHVMVHRYRKKTLTVEQLKILIAENNE